MPQVSVVIPVYNIEAHLRQCLDSVAGQTLSDLEVICVDDGSTDTSPAILEEYAQKDPRFQVIRQANAGPGAARNRGMERSSGRYLIFLDSDDWFEPDFLERMTARAEETGADVTICRADEFDTHSGQVYDGSWMLKTQLLPGAVFSPREAAGAVFQFTYDIDTFMRDDAGNLDTWSDLKLACWLLHADGAYSEGATDYLTRRFLEDPDTWFDALSVFPDSPWEHADIVVAAPVNDTYAWYGQEEQDRLTEILDTYQPENDAQQALLDALKEARPQAIERATENATASFCLVTEGQFLSLGRKEGGYPWDYEGLPETPQSAGTGDNGESLFTFSFGGVDVAYLDADGTDNIYRMTTTVPGPRTLGGIQVGDSEDDVKAVYTGAVQMEAVGEDQFGADYALIHEPGGLSYCKHISFFITDGEVSAIQVEDLVDGRLLS